MKNRSILFASLLILVACDKSQNSSQSPILIENAQNQHAEVIVPELSVEPDTIYQPPREYTFAEKLVQAALERTTQDVVYDGRYMKIAYPMGDVPASIGVCTDVVIRSYRQVGVDLQQLVHEDISQHFKRYPNQSRWGLSKPDTNIDHRRVPNLQVFFSRHGESLPITKKPSDYLPGDIVTWKINDKMAHIGIVSEQKAFDQQDRYMIIHNIGNGPEIGDMLFSFKITGHYRYKGEDKGNKGI